jgi:hypothetical protein
MIDARHDFRIFDGFYTNPYFDDANVYSWVRYVKDIYHIVTKQCKNTKKVGNWQFAVGKKAK